MTDMSGAKESPGGVGGGMAHGPSSGDAHDGKHLPLSIVKPGRQVRVLNVGGGRGLRNRLASMGLLPGTEMRVISEGTAGPCIVAVRGTRLMLGRGAAHQVLVEELS